MTAMQTMRRRLVSGQVLLLDGATGTELERRNAPMSEHAWCALATETAPDILRAVHEDYIRAGADIITANTYASSRIMLGAGGMADKVEPLNRRAVEIALEARERAAEGRPVAVAGSISNMMPMVPHEARIDTARMPTPKAAEASYREQAQLLKQAGVDLILLEMHYRPEYLKRSIRAPRDTGLPVWVGTSARRDAKSTGSGRILGFAVEEDLPFEKVVDAVLSAGANEVIGVMHTNVSITGAALDIVGERYGGPLMAYPDSGYFEMPNWKFADVIAPAALAEEARGWIAQGAQIIGGCCGTGVEHIVALREMLDRRAAGG